MVSGMERSVAGAMFVGYHARVGTQNAILDHTWSSSCIANLRLQGQEVGEIGLNGAVCGNFGVPVVLVSGDQAACAEAPIRRSCVTAVVKKASGRMAAERLPPTVAQQAIMRRPSVRHAACPPARPQRHCNRAASGQR
jgi:D-amino peptidase